MMPVAATSFAMRAALLFELFTCGPYACSPKSSGGADRGESGEGIHVLAATYGGNCHAPHGNATARLAAACNGKPSCTYKVDVEVLGDPAPLCAKEFLAEWSCGKSTTVKQAKSVLAPAQQGEAGYGSIVTLACDER
jgi:hypothetical protein